MKYVLLANLGATLFMVGVIWFVQIVHYPLFSRVGTEAFAAYSGAHTRLTGYVVGPPMLLEAGTALLLVLRRPEGVPPWAAIVGLGLVGAIWASTALLQVPRHTSLGSGFDRVAHDGLVLANWLRTVAWSARGALVLRMAARHRIVRRSGLRGVVHVDYNARQVRVEGRRGGALGNRRVALKPHAARIRTWVDEGRGDEWIARELNTTPSSVQSFRSRNSIYRRDPVRRGRLSEHPVVLDEHGDGLVLITDALKSEVFRNEWRDYLRRPPEDLQIVVTQDRIYLEKVR